MKIKLLALLLFTMSFTTVPAQRKISFDGYYVHTSPDTLSPFRYILRFYTDSTVITVTTAGNIKNLIPWFNKDHKEVTKGRYTVRDSTIHILIKTKDGGEVNYEGVVTTQNELYLKVKSGITRYEGEEYYLFMKMEGLK